jgi:ATP-dependent Lhr-like helicase
LTTPAQKALATLRQRGASFFAEIRQHTDLLPAQLEQALAELVANGLLTSDSFTGLRALLTPESRKPSHRSGGRQRGRRGGFSIEEAGRWSLIPAVDPEQTLDNEALEELVMIYLRRWGVVSRQILARESCAPAWRDLLPVLRRFELRGTLRGGRFIEGLGGEQFALPETIAPLRAMSKAEAGTDYGDSQYCSLAATDPVNNLPLFLPDVKLARTNRNRVLYRDGIPLAVLDGDAMRFLREVPTQYQWALEQLLRRNEVNPRLRSYLA